MGCLAMVPLRRHASRALLVLGLALLAACATRGYQPVQLDSVSFIERALVQEQGPLRISASVPTAEETEALVGLDLYEQGIQPVWIKVENRGERNARVALWSIDRDYFSPIEVAYMNRKKFSKQGYRDMERWFYDNGLPRQIPAGESRSGLVFTALRRGTKGFNLDLFAGSVAYHFTFFVPLPGFTPDFEEVDFEGLFAEAAKRDLDMAGLRQVLEQEMPCCSTGPDNVEEGGPLNVVLVGTGLALRRSLLRGGWLESERDMPATQSIRRNHYRGREPDAVFSINRSDGGERMVLQFWMAPWLAEGEPVWLGQVYYTIVETSLLAATNSGVKVDKGLLSPFARESLSADVDSAKRFLLQNLWYNQSLKRWGVVPGMAPSTEDNPRTTFGGFNYFTDGQRFVFFLSEEPVGLDETDLVFESLKRMPGGGGDV